MEAVGVVTRDRWLWVHDDPAATVWAVGSLRRPRSRRLGGVASLFRVNTNTFQAPGFYARLGYPQIGVAEDSPVGYGEMFLEKRSCGQLADPDATDASPVRPAGRSSTTVVPDGARTYRDWPDGTSVVGWCSQTACRATDALSDAAVERWPHSGTLDGIRRCWRGC
jgi:hypothetical protein